MELKLLLLFHLLGASVWTGGHLVLSISILPKAWKNKDVEAIRTFENSFEKIGIPSLIIQVLTGIRLAMIYLPNFADWFNFSTPPSKHIGTKFILLLITILLAIHARFFVIPKLNSQNIGFLGLHIILVTLTAITFVLTGLSFRTGILF